MDGLRFDALTRRGFGVATGGFVATLAGLTAPEPAARKKKKRCKKLSQRCQPGNKSKRCCKNLGCDVGFGGGPKTCCLRRQAVCEFESQCCGDENLGCFTIAGLDQQDRCCGSTGASCSSTDDCCITFACSGGQCVP